MMERFTDITLWVCATALVPFMDYFVCLINKYLFTDWSFLKWLVVLLILDLLTGIWKSYSKKEAMTSRGLRMTLSKVIQYSVFLIVIHVLVHFTIDGERVTMLDWLDDYAYTFLMCIEARSIWENINEIKKFVDIKDIISQFISNLSINFKKKQ